jgi:hypothetical protein
VEELHAIEQIIGRLKSPASRDDHYLALQEYSRLIRSGLSAEAGMRAINAAVEFPVPEDVTRDPAASLIGYLADSRFPQDHGVAVIPSIIELYPSMPVRVRSYSIWLLMNIPEREGAGAVMDLVRRYFSEGGIPEFAFNSRYLHPLHADVYFPELLDYARLTSHFHAFEIWNICLKYCDSKVLQPERIVSRAGSILAEYQSLDARLIAGQSDWRKNDEYLALRETAGLLLDIMRFFPSDEIKQELSSALIKYRDPVLLCWACISVLWLDLPLPAAIIESIAASDEARKPFYEKLKDHNRVEIFPQQYRTKESFAQSDLVNWLTYPTELGHVPDAIELTHKVVEQTDRGTDEWFLFRFQDTDMKSSAWLAGWSGPFPTDSPPGEILTPGSTFSQFERWDSTTPDGHLDLDDDADPSRKLTIIPYSAPESLN